MTALADFVGPLRGWFSAAVDAQWQVSMTPKPHWREA